MDQDKPHFHGHRNRLRQRVLEHGAGSLADYEVLEFLLFGAKPRGDVKPLAKLLIERFGSLAGALAATPTELKAVPGMGDSSVAAFKMVRRRRPFASSPIGPMRASRRSTASA